MKRHNLIFTLLLACSGLQAQELQELHRYDETNSNLEGHTTQILQDHRGLLWISTWNGIYRFDGYEFRRMKPQPGDSCSMTSDRIRDIWLNDEGHIYVRNDDGDYLFNTNTYRFSDVTGEALLQQAEEQRHNQPTRGKLNEGRLEYIDPQGLMWMFHKDALYCMSRAQSPAQPLPMHQPAMVRCLMLDQQRRVWVSTKEDATLRLINADGELIGYMSPNGTLGKNYQAFGQSVYCITQTHSGKLWLGCKPGGLFRLSESLQGQFRVEPVEGLLNTSVYSICEDQRGRLWIGTLGGGIACIENPESPRPLILNELPGYPKEQALRVRHIYITEQNMLLAATTDGLIVAKVEDNPRQMKFALHRKDPNRPSSLSCNAVMDVVGTPDGRLFVATETGGVCELISPNLLADTLQFSHYNVDNGRMPTDMTVGMTLATDGHLLVTSQTRLINLDTNRGTYESLGHHTFHNVYHFSEARPLLLPDDRMLVATLDGAFFLPTSSAHHNNYQPPLLLTALSFANGNTQMAVTALDTLRLSPDERSLTIHFAALDYVDPWNISYQYRIGSDTTAQWANLGHAHSITLLDLDPGTYELSVRSTNADGVWTNNVRTLTMIVEPTFWETPWAIVLLVAIALLVILLVVGTLLYIRRINRKHKETLAAYLELLPKLTEASTLHLHPSTLHPSPSTFNPPPFTLHPSPSTLDDPFMQRVLSFVDKNIGNSDADIGQMADECAVSRSVLQRRMKQMMGVTPADFLREARLKRACQLLCSTDAIVSEVAYRCGFSDPKYFSRCFKQSVGMSPTEYRETECKA